MKLSYRDKVIFIVAIVAIIAVAGVFLFIKPHFEDMNYAKDVLERKQAEKAKVESKINTLPELVTQLKASAEEVEELQSYFLEEQSPYQNEEFVHKMLDGARLEVVSMNTEYTIGGNLNEYVVNPKNVHSYELLIKSDLYNELPPEVYDNYNKVRYGRGANIVVGVTYVNAGFKDSDLDGRNLFSFIDAVAKDEMTYTIPKFSAKVNEKEGVKKYEGSIDLVLYSLHPLNIEKIMEESDQVEITTVAAE